MAEEIQKIIGSNQSKLIKVALTSCIPLDAPNWPVLETRVRTTSESTQVPMAKKMTRRRNIKDAVSAAKAAQTMGATAMSQYGDILRLFDA